MPRLDLSAIPVRTGSGYPPPYAEMMRGRSSLRLGQAGGLTQFGVNLVTLEPGAMSALRHWHEKEDEFVLVTEGELTLVENEGEAILRPGDCAAFPAGVANGHHLVNRSAERGTFLVVGTRAAAEVAHYSDADMMVRMDDRGAVYTRRDGSPVEGA